MRWLVRGPTCYPAFFTMRVHMNTVRRLYMQIHTHEHALTFWFANVHTPNRSRETLKKETLVFFVRVGARERINGNACARSNASDVRVLMRVQAYSVISGVDKNNGNLTSSERSRMKPEIEEQKHVFSHSTMYNETCISCSHSSSFLMVYLIRSELR